jgi:PASTA domain
MSRLRPVRILAALFAVGLALMLSASGPAPAAAAGTAKPSPPPRAQGDAGVRALPAGATACPTTPAKPSSSFAACDTTPAAAAGSKATVSLPSGAAACASSAAKPSSTAAACTRPKVGPTSPARPTDQPRGQSGALAPLAAFTVDLTFSPVSLAPGGTTTLTATSNQDVGPTPWFIEIFQAASGAFLVECGSGTTCATSVTQSGSGLGAFIAYVSGFGTTSPPPSIQATSTPVLVSWLSVTLSASDTVLQPDGTTELTATSSLSVSPTPWSIEIFDVTTGTLVVECGFGTTCSTFVTRGPAVSTYVAYVAARFSSFPPSDIRSQSAGVVVSWITLGLSILPGNLPAGGTATVTADTVLDVGPTPFWIEVFDQTSGTQVVICGSGFECVGSVSQPGATQHSYIAYVAGFGGALPPPNIRATSNTVLVNWFPAAPVVPNLTGETAAEAGQTLQSAGLVLGGQTTVGCVNSDQVSGQSPAPGTQVAAGAAVSITLGTAPVPPHVCP